VDRSTDACTFLKAPILSILLNQPTRMADSRPVARVSAAKPGGQPRRGIRISLTLIRATRYTLPLGGRSRTSTSRRRIPGEQSPQRLRGAAQSVARVSAAKPGDSLAGGSRISLTLIRTTRYTLKID
jgi:hypothetical protein